MATWIAIAAAALALLGLAYSYAIFSRALEREREARRLADAALAAETEARQSAEAKYKAAIEGIQRDNVELAARSLRAQQELQNALQGLRLADQQKVDASKVFDKALHCFSTLWAQLRTDREKLHQAAEQIKKLVQNPGFSNAKIVQLLCETLFWTPDDPELLAIYENQLAYVPLAAPQDAGQSALR
jgi:hypothetical protein